MSGPSSLLHSRAFWQVLLPVVGLMATAIVLSTIAGLPAGVWLTLLALLFIAGGVFAWRAAAHSADVFARLGEMVRGWGSDEPGSDFHRHRLPWEARPLGEIIQSTSREIANREAQLRQDCAEHAGSTALLEAVLRTMVEGVVVVDRELRVLFANEAARPLLDLRTRSTVGRAIWEVARLPRIQEMLKGVIETREQTQAEVELPRTKSIVSVTATPLPDEPVPGAVLVLQDVTELRRLESVRRDFVSNVSHELKTPLTSIQAYADTLLSAEDADPAQQQQFLERIITESERLHQLIVEIIRLGQIESQPDLFEIEPVCVDTVARECLETHHAIAQSKGVNLHLEPPAEPISVSADPHELRTILDNLLDNACKFTPGGGQVTVRWRAEGTHGLIEVEDTGIGIPSEQRGRVFERFYRVDRARDRDRGGTGLGLAIVKHLCQLFGGSVDVRSQLGRGSTFCVRLPLALPGVETSLRAEATHSTTPEPTVPA
jgi:two-component system phosphate regulon sensor histidine kinase PhoR